MLAALFGAAFVYLAFTRYDPIFVSRANFDATAGWLGLALLCLAVATWDGARPHPSTWAARLAAFVRRHWWELALVLPMVGFVVFMFMFRYGEFPPSNLICCEERLRGEGGFEVLQGGRPLQFALSRYSTAFGFLLFGENTLGLRFPLILAGVLIVPVFYLLLRELVRPPAALFATALLAASWPLVTTAAPGQLPRLESVLFAFLLVLGIRRRNALALLGAGVLAGLLSYEYATWKALPLIAGGFLTALVAYRLAFPLPEGARAFLERLSSLVRSNGRSVVAFVGGALIAATPLLVTIDQGGSFYFSSLDRQRLDRGGGLFAGNWDEQLKWAAELFSPLGQGSFPYRFIPSEPLVDPITGTLLALGVILGVVMFWRPFRLLFLAWYLGVLGAGALLAFQFAPWKFIGLLPAGFVLAAFVVDDADGLARRWARGAAAYLLPLLLLVSTVFVAYWNADTFLGTATKSTTALREYENTEGMQYALCDYLRGRGDENFSYAFGVGNATLGFAQPHETPNEQDLAWGEVGIVGRQDVEPDARRGAAGVHLPNLNTMVSGADRNHDLFRPAPPLEPHMGEDGVAVQLQRGAPIRDLEPKLILSLPRNVPHR